jgi:diaminopimelate epimerase
MSFSFSKYHGTGNDFIFFDDRGKNFPIEKNFIKKLCHRNFGIGGDGLVLLQESKSSDYRMRIFNSDGSEASCCGNALFCVFRFLEDLFSEKSHIENSQKSQKSSSQEDQKIQQQDQEQFQGKEKKKEITIETMHGVSKGFFSQGKSHVYMPSPKILFEKRILEYDGKKREVFFVNSGVPHAVVFVEELEKQNVDREGRFFRYHSAFSHEGANVNFAQKTQDSQKIAVRTYERGVEAETLSCGTGALAVATIGAKIFSYTSPVKIQVSHGEIEVHFQKEEEKFSQFLLVGRPSFVFSGKISLGAF